ncbi:MAG: hypothetical protein IJR96_01685 [Pseudobutyrivibrio sp.]|nr:hypothetical protein [Pseudobutyrivibrio sp.]
MLNNSFSSVVNKLMCASLVFIITIVGLTGCGSTAEPKAFIDISEDGKTITANFDKTEKGTGGGSGITIEEGEYLVLDCGLTKGSVHVTVTSGGDDINENPTEEKPATIDYVFSEAGTTEYEEIQPGSYMVSVTVDEKASGTMTFNVKSEE